MKHYQLPFIFLILLFTACNKTNDKATIISTPTKSDRISINAIDSLFAWDVEDVPGGRMMYLDVPFDLKGKTEYLSLTVAKKTNKERPSFISVIVPNDLDDNPKMEMVFISQDSVKENNIYPKFEGYQDDFCIFRMKNAYAFNKDNKQVDVLHSFLTYDNVGFVFFRKNKEKISVFMPLYTFKEQYK